jgi:predicted alpha/beta-fold hydrolase
MYGFILVVNVINIVLCLNNLRKKERSWSFYLSGFVLVASILTIYLVIQNGGHFN